MSVPLGLKEFHVSAASRDAHGFDEAMFSSSGRVVFTNFAAARRFAQSLNARNPSRGARAGDVNAMGLIDEVLHALIAEYRTRQKPNLWREALQTLEATLGADRVAITLQTFGRDFPPVAVYQKRVTLQTYLKGSTDGVSNREVLLEEMLLLWLENQNPAFQPYQDLFDDSNLRLQTVYANLISSLESYLEAQEPFLAAGGLTLWRVLRLPALSFPGSLEGQLRMLLERFGGAFNASRFADRIGGIRTRLLSSLDLIAEDNRFLEALEQRRQGGGADGFAGGFAGDARVQRVSQEMLEYEPEAFTQDQSWMPRLVLMAKNAFVWLDQLRKSYGPHVQTLRDVPDAELERMASWGITGLWLIGLWERSAASKEIKHRMGNPDAVASAYSLYDYAIAAALGGDAALDDLKARAWRVGIRMASDMVPNHAGIDGKWVVEHPEWFLQTAEPPFPGYSFQSADLGHDERVGVILEDHYYDKTDAAVVFKRVDRYTGSVSYLYHGNDGSGLPWNDTAQLNYLRSDVREAVIQTILHVARQFPVIRFDAAMTLAKKHIKRLWFPEPGSGDGIASRSEYGLTKEEFDALMPQEFWREVVDRAAVEAPDTLLLAEAFWMMEGYFVRSLGMHRVYNSAFMNMLRDEKNGEYRTILRETAAIEPEILKRYVNFLNNPDEKTAVEQFGKGDKYFGIMTLCATLPGLPMIGHGQIEGYAEKYGMEYQRAYYDERPDEGLVSHHASQIFPLLKKRALFAETENFVIYDFVSSIGTNDNVYAYSNAKGSERALVIYNNSRDFTIGSLRDGQGAKKSSSITEGLGLTAQSGYFAIYRDLVSNLEFISSSQELQSGMNVELPAYGRSVLLDWREVYDADGRYARVNRMLEGQGVESVEAVTMELYLERVLTPWNALVNASNAMRLSNPDARLYGELEARGKALADGIEAQIRRDLDGNAFATQLRASFERLAEHPAASDAETLEALGVTVTSALEGLTATDPRNLLDEWLLSRQLERAFRDVGLSGWDAARATARVKFLVSQFKTLDAPSLTAWRSDLDAPAALGLNAFEGAVYINAEQLEATANVAKRLGADGKNVDALLGSAAAAGYRIDTLSEPKAKKPAVSRKAPANRKAPAKGSREPTVSSEVKPAPKKKPSTKQAEVQAETTSSQPMKAGSSESELMALKIAAEPPAEKPKTETPAASSVTVAKAVKPNAVTKRAASKAVEPTVAAPLPTPKTSSQVVASKSTPSKSTLSKSTSSKPVTSTPASSEAPLSKSASSKAASAPAPVPAKTSSAKVAQVKTATSQPTAKPATKPKAAPVQADDVQADDLTRIVGIGPKVAAALNEAGIVNFAQLSAASETDLRGKLEAVGIKLFRNLETWAGQAKALGAPKTKVKK